MTIQIFEDVEEYAQALKHAEVEFLIQNLEHARWEVGQLEFGKISIEWGLEGGGILSETKLPADGYVFFFPICGLHRVNGNVVCPKHAVLFGPNAEATMTTMDATVYRSLFMPADYLDANVPSEASSSQRVNLLAAKTASTLSELLREIIGSAQTEAKVLTSTAAISSITEQLIVATRTVVGTLSDEPIPHELVGRKKISRREVIGNTQRIIDNECDLPTIHALAESLGVSERTLRYVFQEYYGISPQRYITIRRLHAARRALKSASPETTTVTAIAAELGFWQFGRFAGMYRRLFGETPSRTLAGSLKLVIPPVLLKPRPNRAPLAGQQEP